MNAKEVTLPFHFRQELALLPIILYVIISAVIMIHFHYYGMKALIMAALISIFIGFFLCAKRKQYWISIVQGLAQYGNARLLMIFVVIGIFSKVLLSGQIGAGFIWMGTSLHLTGGAFVVFCFLGASLISMGAGAPIAALLAVIPIFYPAGVLLGANPEILCGALMSGIFFGDALSPSSQVIHTTIASQHDPITKQSAPLLPTLKLRLPYLITIAVISAIFFYFLGGKGGNSDSVAQVATLCNPKGLWMLLPILVLLIICFRTSDLFLGVSWAIIIGLFTGFLSGTIPFSDFIYVDQASAQIHGILMDGLSNVVDIIISTMLLYGLIAIAVDGGMMKRCCDFLLTVKLAQSKKGASIIIALGVGIVNILLAGCVLPSILMFADIADTIGQKAELPAIHRSILLCAMTTNITAIIPINSAFVMGAITVIEELAQQHSALPLISPIQIFLSSFYCLLLSVVCILWIFVGMGKKEVK